MKGRRRRRRKCEEIVIIVKFSRHLRVKKEMKKREEEKNWVSLHGIHFDCSDNDLSSAISF